MMNVLDALRYRLSPPGSNLLQPILFGGEKGARNVPADAGPGMPVDAAKNMEQSGAGASDIFQRTGWYRAPDGQWKWTLSDKGADLNSSAFQAYTTGSSPTQDVMLKGNGPRKLSDVLNHPNLYETYPNLKNTNVERLPSDIARSGVTADYNPAANTMRIADDRPRQDVLSAMLHELQHGVQHLEGFGVGGAMTEFYRPSDLQSMPPEAAAAIKAKAFQDYQRLAGETEARQVQRQFETQDWSQLPTRMEGFPAPDQQLVRSAGSFTATPGKSYQLAPADHDPFASPLNQLLLLGRQAPFALY